VRAYAIDERGIQGVQLFASSEYTRPTRTRIWGEGFDRTPDRFLTGTADCDADPVNDRADSFGVYGRGDVCKPGSNNPFRDSARDWRSSLSNSGRICLRRLLGWGSLFSLGKRHGRQAGCNQRRLCEEFPTGCDVRRLRDVIPFLRRGVAAFRETIASHARIVRDWPQELPNGKPQEAQRTADPGPQACERS
jgi:hypothetical protein